MTLSTFIHALQADLVAHGDCEVRLSRNKFAKATVKMHRVAGLLKLGGVPAGEAKEALRARNLRNVKAWRKRQKEKGLCCNCTRKTNGRHTTCEECKTKDKIRRITSSSGRTSAPPSQRETGS